MAGSMSPCAAALEEVHGERLERVLHRPRRAALLPAVLLWLVVPSGPSLPMPWEMYCRMSWSRPTPCFSSR